MFQLHHSLRQHAAPDHRHHQYIHQCAATSMYVGIADRNFGSMEVAVGMLISTNHAHWLTPDYSIHHTQAGGPLLDGKSMQDAGPEDQPRDKNDSRRENGGWRWWSETEMRGRIKYGAYRILFSSHPRNRPESPDGPILETAPLETAAG